MAHQLESLPQRAVMSDMARHRLPAIPSMVDHFSRKWTLLRGYFACTLEALFGMEFCMSIKMDPVAWPAVPLLSSAAACAPSLDHAELEVFQKATQRRERATAVIDPTHIPADSLIAPDEMRRPRWLTFGGIHKSALINACLRKTKFSL